MKKTFTSLLLATFLLLQTTQAQLTYTAASGINTTQAYTDLGTNGTAIPVSEFDDANSAPQDIGFSFFFNGTSYTQFILNTNGYIKLGATPPVSAGIDDVLVSAETDVIAALNIDLDGIAPEFRVYTSGTAPNRICTIQFKNLQDFFRAPATAPQFASIEFQVKLFETSNNIELVYGNFTAGAAAPAVMATVAGIKGTDAFSSVNVTKSSTTAWSAATFINRNYTVNKHNIRNNVLPVAGQTYRFTTVTLPVNDASVLNVYSLSKVPLNYGGPQTITSMIKNAGGTALTNLAVTLNVSGANTFSNVQTIPSLPAGASTLVSFAAFNPTAIGTNTITVTVPSDDVNTGNSAGVTQSVTTDTYSYADDAAAAGNVGFNTSSGITLVKYNMVGTGVVTNVNVQLSNTASAIGNTVYAVVMDAAGTIVGQSANLVITAADQGAYKNFIIPTPPSFTNSAFYVGLAQTANPTVGYLSVAYQSEAAPTRSGAYYRSPIAGGVAPTENTTQGRYMIQAIVSNTPLPVTLTDFSGRVNGNTALLQWITTFESNSDRFEIERSIANESWSKVGSVAASGNSSITRKYSFADPGLASGTWLYRLKMIDKDGQYTYSAIITLVLSGNNVTTLLQNYPNPVKDVTRIPYQVGKAAMITLEVFGADGRKISAANKGVHRPGSYNVSLNAQSLGLASGKYIYRIIVQDEATGEITTYQKQMTVNR